MSVEQAREAFIEYLRREFGDDVADERADGIRSAREDSEDFIVGYLAALQSPRDEVERLWRRFREAAVPAAFWYDEEGWKLRTRQFLATIRGKD